MTPTSPVHTHTRLAALCPALPGWAGTRTVKPIWILLEQESGSGISWDNDICQSAPRSRQITMPAPTTQFLRAGCPSYRPTNSVKALKAYFTYTTRYLIDTAQKDWQFYVLHPSTSVNNFLRLLPQVALTNWHSNASDSPQRRRRTPASSRATESLYIFVNGQWGSVCPPRKCLFPQDLDPPSNTRFLWTMRVFPRMISGQVLWLLQGTIMCPTYTYTNAPSVAISHIYAMNAMRAKTSWYNNTQPPFYGHCYTGWPK